jgi:HSP20 family protein
MDVDKLKKWLDVAQQFQGENFWSDIFESTTNSQAGKMPNPQGEQVNHSKPRQAGPTPPQEKAIPVQEAPSVKPAIDIFEADSEWIIWVDLPGIQKSDIQLNLIGRQLVIKGVAPLPFPDVPLIHSERLNGTFERTINMPDNLSTEAQPLAKFTEGILEIRLQREQPKKHKIKID